MRYAVLGGGMQGRIIAANLAARASTRGVVVADVRAPASPLPAGVQFRETDARDMASVARAVADADAVVVALPGEVGKEGLARAIATGKPIVDVSFTPETLVDLDDDARRSGACVVVDCGVAPGLSHILAADAREALGELDALDIHVGGLPQAPPPVFRHAVYFHAEDLLAEYFRPARLRRGGIDAAPAPLDAPVDSFEDPELGRLDAFATDGLRTLLTSYPEIREMREMTLRWPGHLEFMCQLRDTGFLDTHALDDRSEPPVRATARVLAARYPADRHPDVLVMVVEGRAGERRARWRLVDRAQAGVSAMARTTGFTTAAVAVLLAQRRYATPGVHPPERLGEAQLAGAVVKDLAARGVHVQRVE